MNAGLLWKDLLLYAAQIAIVAVAAGLIAAVVRLRAPSVKLLYWQAAIAACLLLPVLRPWKTELADGAVTLSTSVILMATSRPAAGWRVPSFAVLMLAAVAAGAAIRFVWLCLGLWRLRRYRLHSTPFDGGAGFHSGAGRGSDFRVSRDVASPVTFGYRNPVVLLPPRFSELDPDMREAILCHEILHIERRDWLWTVAEEIVRAAFWFHPAIWWLLGEAQLAREQAVDRIVIERTGARDRYLDALLAIAGAPARLDLAPAPLFLKRRHLKQRVISIVKEVRMSKTRLMSTLAAGAAMLAGVCWMVTGAIPLVGAPQNVNDGAGVTVQAGSVPLIHRAPVLYPEEALAKGIAGTVVVQAKLGGDASVVDASVVSGPEELRAAALESVLKWHFDRSAAGTTQQVSIDFAPPARRTPPGAEAPTAPGRTGTLQSGSPHDPQMIRSIDVSGISDEARLQLLAQMPVKVGDTMTMGDAEKITKAIRAFDSHLMLSVNPAGGGGVALRVQPRSAGAQSFNGSVAGTRIIRVGGNVAQANLITKITPVYPPEAKAARIQGIVQFDATIGEDGHVENLQLVSGPPELVNSAMSAVRQWVYRPTLLNGQPVPILTRVDINYTLSQ